MSLRIAVVGGGIGGLAAAGFLHKAGLGVTVYEQAARIAEVGAGLVVTPNAVRLLRRLGHIERFQDRAVPLEIGWEFRRWQDGSVLFSQRLGADCERLYGEQCYVAHRADLLDVLRAAVTGPGLRLGSRCIAVRRHRDEVELAFADGSNSAADVVIGADGLHSVVSQAVTTTQPPRFSGMCAYRCLIPADRAPRFALRPVQTLWLGPDHHLVHYPIAARRYVNIVAFAPAHDWQVESWTAEGRVEDLRAEFAGWDPQLTGLLQAAKRTGRWALLDRGPLPRWTNGPITLAGDAAHPMFPFLAQGAAQAIEDAAVLAGCLAANTADPPAALARYETLRKPRTTRLQMLSHARQHTNHLPDGPEQRARDASLARQDPLAHNAWIYGHDAEDSLLLLPAEAIEEGEHLVELFLDSRPGRFLGRPSRSDVIPEALDPLEHGLDQPRPLVAVEQVERDPLHGLRKLKLLDIGGVRQVGPGAGENHPEDRLPDCHDIRAGFGESEYCHQNPILMIFACSASGREST
jgi:salicylate hydroxylase